MNGHIVFFIRSYDLQQFRQLLPAIAQPRSPLPLVHAFAHSAGLKALVTIHWWDLNKCLQKALVQFLAFIRLTNLLLSGISSLASL